MVQWGLSALMGAVWHDAVDAVRFLLEKNANTRLTAVVRMPSRRARVMLPVLTASLTVAQQAGIHKHRGAGFMAVARNNAAILELLVCVHGVDV